MADQLQLRGGSTAQTATFTGALREVTVDTDKKTVVVHDGTTAGGNPLLRQDLSNLPAGTIDNADINASAGIVDTKLATIATAGKVSNSATTATSAATNSAIVARDGSGNFAAGTVSANLVANAGSVGASSISFTGDTNTGIYSPGADQLAIATGGVQRLLVDASGNLTASGGLTAANLNGGPLAGFRNRIINGNFDIWQRGTSFTDDGYTADRWVNYSAGTTHVVTRPEFSVGEASVPNQPIFYSRTVVTSVAGAANASLLLQKIEGVRSFAGQEVTVSFWARVDSPKNISPELVQSFGTGGAPSADVTAIGGARKVSIGTSWQQVSFTTTAPSISGKTLGTDINDCLVLNIWFEAGSDFNSRTDSLGQQSGTFDIAQVQIEPGPFATPFEHRPLAVELALCQRYFNKTKSIFRTYQAAGEFLYCYTLPVQMRAQPNTAVISTTGSSGPTAIAVYNNAYDGQNVNIGVTTTGAATFAYAVTEFSASAEL